MGYTKEQAIKLWTSRLIIPIEVGENEPAGEVKVEHHFRTPDIGAIENYRKDMQTFKRGKMKMEISKANWALWWAQIASVVGYDDLPTEGDFRQYFTEGPERQHADRAVSIMMDGIAADEEESGN